MTYTVEKAGGAAPGVSDTYFSVSNNDLGSSDCRTMLSSVPRRTGS